MSDEKNEKAEKLQQFGVQLLSTFTYPLREAKSNSFSFIVSIHPGHACMLMIHQCCVDR
jgi:hypothetical protein